MTEVQPSNGLALEAPWRWPVIELVAGSHALLEGEFTQPWYQGRGAYGGVLAALCVHAMELVEPARALRTFTLHCLNPALVGPARVKAELLSRGGRVSHLRAQLWAGETPVGHASATFALPRKSGLMRGAEPAPHVPPPHEVPEVPAGIPFVPEFTKQLSYRYCIGALPYSGAQTPVLGGWCDFRAGFEVDYPMIAALLDIWPPAMFASLKAPLVAASVDFSYHLLSADLSALKRPFLYKGESRSIVDGYAEERDWLWDANGTPVAVARQLIALG